MDKIKLGRVSPKDFLLEFYSFSGPEERISIHPRDIQTNLHESFFQDDEESKGNSGELTILVGTPSN